MSEKNHIAGAPGDMLDNPSGERPIRESARGPGKRSDSKWGGKSGANSGGHSGGAADDAVKLATCDHPGCQAQGEFRAPRSRTELTRFYWFCLEHVREYNAAWNYYADMDEAAIEAEIRKEIVWQRPPSAVRSGTGCTNHKSRYKTTIQDTCENVAP